MEFQNLGKHCAEPACKQLDFLPFECSACHKIFCLDHRSFATHKCPNTTDKYAPECPMCGQVIPISKDDDPNQKEHITQGCPRIATKNPSFSCSLPKCSKTEVMPVVCSSCRKNFCLKHRMPQDHQCIIEERKRERKEKMSAAANAAKKGKYDTAVRNATNKTNPTALKVAMMKMKMHASGDDRIPQERRFYLEVVYPIESNVLPKMMFFDQNYSIGKVLDLVADAGNIENNNNKINSEKLHLILLKDGTIIPNENTIGKVENLFSGDSVLLGTLHALSQ